MINIRRLADHLNISIGTVSRALNNRPGVHPETLEKVLKAAAELGYVPNQSGRSLRRGATNTIGFVIETGHPAHQSGDQFFYVVLDAMNLYLAERHYDLVILPCHSADDPVEFLSRVIARGTVDALVITATRRFDHRIAMLARSRLPFLTLGRSETPGSYSWIDLDFEGVARRSVMEAAKLGHRRIAVGLPDNDVALGYHYKAGYLSGMTDAGLHVDESLIMRVPTSEEGGFRLGLQIAAMEHRPSALLLCSEVTAAGVYAALAQEGLEVGRDISIVAFRENPLMRFLNPMPACFRLDLKALGTLIGKAVLDMLAPTDDTAVGPRSEIVGLEFLSGASLQPPAG
jgi:DNA-binding LacI/PurR family transcriptional regulator